MSPSVILLYISLLAVVCSLHQASLALEVMLSSFNFIKSIPVTMGVAHQQNTWIDLTDPEVNPYDRRDEEPAFIYI